MVSKLAEEMEHECEKADRKLKEVLKEQPSQSACLRVSNPNSHSNSPNFRMSIMSQQSERRRRMV